MRGIIDENDSHMQQLNEVFLNNGTFELQPERNAHLKAIHPVLYPNQKHHAMLLLLWSFLIF